MIVAELVNAVKVKVGAAGALGSSRRGPSGDFEERDKIVKKYKALHLGNLEEVLDKIKDMKSVIENHDLHKWSEVFDPDPSLDPPDWA